MKKRQKTIARTESNCSDRLKVIADPTRLAVLRQLLDDGPRTVGELNLSLKVEQSLLSHHLQILRESGLVLTTRDGKSVRYELTQDTLRAARNRKLDLGCCSLSFPR